MLSCPFILDVRFIKSISAITKYNRAFRHCNIYKTKETQTPWPEPASELYRLIDRCLSAKLVPTFADRRVSRSQRGGSPTAVISVF
jgi:hypothetical protein